MIWEANPKRTQAISAGVAYEVTRILQQNIKSGTGTRADIDRPAAGKTGTATELVRRLVLRLHAQPLHRGVDGRPRRPGAP